MQRERVPPTVCGGRARRASEVWERAGAAGARGCDYEYQQEPGVVGGAAQLAGDPSRHDYPRSMLAGRGNTGFALWRARGLAEQSLAPPLSARQTSVSAGSARKNSAISSMSGHSNGSLPAVRTSVMVSNHL